MVTQFVNIIDLTLFTGPTSVIEQRQKNRRSYTSGEINLNHFCGKTMISFVIPNETFVSLKVYSMLGKEIAELAGRNFSSGNHVVEFKNGKIANGIYLYSIKAGILSASRKILFPVH